MMNEKIDQAENANESSNTKSSKGIKANIGESIVIVGDVSGKEDLLINGSIEGDINFRESNIVVGEKGRINANVTAKNISVEGDVKGELRASEQITIESCGRVIGDICAPRVVLDDGCQFKGSVDMEEMLTADNRTPKLHLTGTKPNRDHAVKLTKKTNKI